MVCLFLCWVTFQPRVTQYHSIPAFDEGFICLFNSLPFVPVCFSWFPGNWSFSCLVWNLTYFLHSLQSSQWVHKTWTCEIWGNPFFVCRMRSIWPLMLRRIWQRGLSDSYLFLSACLYDFCISMYGISFVRYESLMLTKLERVKFEGNFFLCAGCDRSDLWCWGESDREGFLIPIFS